MITESTKPTFSIVIPVFNTEKYLKECVESILNQAYDSYEIILVDDGSKDSSLQICREYEARDKRIRAIHKENGGVSSARNTGIELAKGKYITFIDSDDWFRQGALPFAAQRLSETGADVLAFSINRVTKAKSYTYTTLEDWTGCIKEITFPLAIGGYFFLLETIKNNNIRFVDGLAYSEDRVFLYAIAPFCKKLSTCPQTYYMYRENTNAATSSKNGKVIMEHQFRATKYLLSMAKDPKHSDFCQQLTKHSVKTMKWGIYAILNNQPKQERYMKRLFIDLFKNEYKHPEFTYYKLYLSRQYLIKRQRFTSKLKRMFYKYSYTTSSL